VKVTPAGMRKRKNATGHGNRYLARVLGEAAISAAKTDTFLGERYRRTARRRGKQKAIVAVGRSILIIVWHLLSDPEANFIDLGPDFYDTRGGTRLRSAGSCRQPTHHPLSNLTWNTARGAGTQCRAGRLIFQLDPDEALERWLHRTTGRGWHGSVRSGLPPMPGSTPQAR
jgi:hypothetical protein